MILLLLVMDVVLRYGLAASLIIPVHLLPLVSLIPSIIFLILSPFLPESPVWLIRSVHQDDIAYMTDLQKESYRPFHTFPQKSYLPFHPFHFTYVYRQGRAEDAKAVLQRLRGPGYDIEPEVKRKKSGSGWFSFGVTPFY